MENASKALLLAAAILIAIILISLGVYIVGQGQETVQGSGEVLDQLSIQQFNNKFDIYEGTVTGSKVKSLIKAVKASNVAYPSQEVKLYNGDAGATKAWEDKDTKEIGTSAKYDVVCEQRNGTGLIDSICIKKVTSTQKQPTGG